MFSTFKQFRFVGSLHTHKVAIINYRLKEVSHDSVTFQWKDYRHGGVKKFMTLTPKEFLRRFALHILPHRYVRIRHYGILSSHGRANVIPLIQDQQNCRPQIDLIVERPQPHPETCPKCKSDKLVSTILLKVRSRAP